MTRASLLGGQDQTLPARLASVTQDLHLPTISTRLRASKQGGRVWEQIKTILSKLGVKIERTNMEHVVKKLDRFITDKKSVLFEGDAAQIKVNVANLEKILSRIEAADPKKAEKCRAIFDKCRGNLNKHKKEGLQKKFSNSSALTDNDYSVILNTVGTPVGDIQSLKEFAPKIQAFLNDEAKQKEIGGNENGFPHLETNIESIKETEATLNYMVLNGDIAGYRPTGFMGEYHVYPTKESLKKEDTLYTTPALTKEKLLEINNYMNELTFPEPDPKFSKPEYFNHLIKILKQEHLARISYDQKSVFHIQQPTEMDPVLKFGEYYDYLVQKKTIAAWSHDERNFYVKFEPTDDEDTMVRKMTWRDLATLENEKNAQ